MLNVYNLLEISILTGGIENLFKTLEGKKDSVCR